MSIHHPITEVELGIIYGRVSDDKQSGAASQKNNLELLARQHSVNVVARVEDDGESGDDLQREGLTSVLSTLEKAHRQGRPVKWLLVDQSDRLSRADSLDTSEVLAKMRRLGVRKVATPARVFDLFEALDRTLLQIEADHKNNPFLKDLGRRVLNGMLEAARGGFWTGQKAPLGYLVQRTPGEHNGRRRTSGKLAIDPETAPLVRELFERYAAGESIRDLTRWLSGRAGRRYAFQGVYKILRRELYAGTRVFGKVSTGRHARLVDGQAAILTGDGIEVRGDVIRLSGWPAIVSPELFAAVQRRLAEGKREARHKGVYVMPLANLSRCGLCGAVMHAQRQGPYPYLRCARHEENPDLCPKSVHARGDVALSRVLDLLSERLLAGDTVASLVALAGEAEDEARVEWERSVRSAEKALAGCEARLATARRRLADASDDLLEDYERLVREVKEEKAATEADLTRLRGAQPVPEEGDAERLTHWLEACRVACERGAKVKDDASEAAMNGLLRVLVKEVCITPPARPKRGNTVGRVEVVLPEWLSRVLSTTAGDSRQHAKSIVLVSEHPE